MELLDRKILYFLKVVEQGSFSGAARELYLTQPALSKQVSKLEEELGFDLLDRSGYRPLLTPKGEQFYQECVKLEQRCRAVLSRMEESVPPSVNIGFTGAFENQELLAFLKEYQTKRALRVNFVRKDFEQCLDDLLRGRVEVSFGIESTYRYSPKVEYALLHSYEMCVITSHSHPLALRRQIEPRELAGEGIVCLSSKFGKGFYKDFMAAFAKDGVIPRIVKEVDSFDELLFSVSLGEGVSIVSQNVASRQVKAVALQHSHHASSYVVAWRKGERRREVLDLVAAAKAHFQGQRFSTGSEL